MNKEMAIEKMNKMGAMHHPFLFVFNFLMDQCYVLTPSEASNYGIFFQFNTHSNCKIQLSNKPINTNLKVDPISFYNYKKSFDLVQQQLLLGNSYLVNLTIENKIETQLTLDQIFQVSHARYKLLFQNQFVVFSPESFLKIETGRISTYPMKGTIDASLENAREIVLSNPKEIAEHATIVDLLRNDLSKNATGVQVERFRYIDEIQSHGKKLLQVSSEISGILAQNYCENIGNIVFDMLPAGSVTGAPKKKTLEIIEMAENYNRGFYTGIAGYFDGTNLDSCVLIRFIENKNGQLVYKSGGGITSQSNAKDEYNELISKIYVPIS